ncbi:hypothetical protein AC1031_013493 [Aphanomyces cochlioides]|nr:hypothetical protein AC1031_013493 [Aphanomyces cochlioides]
MWARLTRRRVCVFCDRSRLETNGIVFEDDLVMAFRDKNPRASVHLLVVPKVHVNNTTKLTSQDAALVEHMWKVGKDALNQECARLEIKCASPVFGFHQPPFNSVEHLHLHCLAPPYEPAWNAYRYMESRLHHFISVETLLERLQNIPSHDNP